MRLFSRLINSLREFTDKSKDLFIMYLSTFKNPLVSAPPYQEEFLRRAKQSKRESKQRAAEKGFFVQASGVVCVFQGQMH